MSRREGVYYKLNGYKRYQVGSACVYLSNPMFYCSRNGGLFS